MGAGFNIARSLAREDAKGKLAELLQALRMVHQDDIERYTSLLDEEFWFSYPDEKTLRERGFWYERFGESLLTSPLEFQKSIAKQMGMHPLREFYTAHYSFAVPSREIIDLILLHSKRIVEVGAGTGFWARLLRDRGCDIVATDGLPEGKKPQTGTFVDVETLDGAEAVKRYPGRDMLCIWPYNDGRWLTDAIGHLEVGRLVIYIGEGDETCGHPSFHQAIRNRELFEPVLESRVAMFPHMHDRLSIVRKLRPLPPSILRLTKTGRNDSSD